VRRSTMALAATALLTAGCGGGASPSAPSAPSTPAPTPTPAPSAVVVLDSGNFDAQVLRATRPVLVEFHSPT
jgi:hypothetical protein